MTGDEDQDFGAMAEEFDELENAHDSRAIRKELRRRLKSDGVQTAFAAMLDICRDKKAPAPARATAAATLFRAAGYLSSKAVDEEDSDGLSLEKLSAEQLELLRKFYADKARRVARGGPRPAARKRRLQVEGGTAQDDAGQADDEAGSGGAFN